MSKIKYFTPREISLHLTTEDIWVSCFGKVLDLSPICKDLDEDDDKIFALLSWAGSDISHFFDEHREVKLHLDPNTNKINTFLPFKPFFGVPSQEEAENLYIKRRKRDEKLSAALLERYRSQRLGLETEHSKISISEWEKQPEAIEENLPWWKDDKYVVGFLTKKPRWIKIMNTMIMEEITMEVCSEETIEDILERYLMFNSHACSYTWKYHGEVLEMKQTLEENGIPDKDEIVDRLRLNSEDYIPTLFLHFNHDLTVM